MLMLWLSQALECCCCNLQDLLEHKKEEENKIVMNGCHNGGYKTKLENKDKSEYHQQTKE